jgi:hypothetical protein
MKAAAQGKDWLILLILFSKYAWTIWFLSFNQTDETNPTVWYANQPSVRRKSLNVKGFGGKALGNPTFHVSRFLEVTFQESC